MDAFIICESCFRLFVSNSSLSSSPDARIVLDQTTTAIRNAKNDAALNALSVTRLPDNSLPSFSSECFDRRLRIIGTCHANATRVVSTDRHASHWNEIGLPSERKYSVLNGLDRGYTVSMMTAVSWLVFNSTF